jgi:exonuclease 3'-5' domain-containing protein 2
MSTFLTVSPFFLGFLGYNVFMRYAQKPKTRKVLGHQVLTQDGYDHCRLLGPDGTLMALIPLKRFKWYLKKGLAKQIDENSIQLNFLPKGNGNVGDDFYLNERKNRCVCCGTDDNFTKHHVVPQEYRIHFPLEMKS